MVVHITLNIFFPDNEGLSILNNVFVLKLAWYFTEWGRFGYNILQTEPPSFVFLSEEEEGGSTWIASNLWSHRSSNF